MTRGLFRSLLLLSLAFPLACSDGPTEPSDPSLGQSFRLSAGEFLTLRGEPVRIGFEAILSDSRCPIDAICIQAGEAKGRFWLEVTAEPATSFELGTLDPRTITVSGYRVTLNAVSPAPRSNARIDPRDYRAELIVER